MARKSAQDLAVKAVVHQLPKRLQFFLHWFGPPTKFAQDRMAVSFPGAGGFALHMTRFS